MKVVTHALISRPFESGRFQIELVDNNSHELITRLAFTRAPGNYAAYPQRVDIMVSLQFVQTHEGTTVRWVSKVICTCPEDTLIYKIENTIAEALNDADAAELAVVAESSKTIAEVPTVPDQLQSSNIPVDDPRSDQRGTTQSAAAEPNQRPTSNEAVSDDVLSSEVSNVEMCDRCKSPRTPTYNFCLNCGHSFGLY